MDNGLLIMDFMAYKFEKLDCWTNAVRLATVVYNLIDKYPEKEKFALSSQTTRTVVSISANIAEGYSRSSKKDFSRFLDIALGSSFELETLLLIALDRKYLSLQGKIVVSSLSELIVKQVYGLKRKLNYEK